MKLVHEIWEETTDDGMVLHTCCLAGSLGTDCRRTNSPTARLISTFEACSHFEAMTIYNRFLGREVYTTPYDEDRLPYPEEWLETQRNSQCS